MDIVEKACSIRTAFEHIAAAYTDDTEFTQSLDSILEDSGLLSVEKIKADYAKNAEKERLLKIGIVGAVKAGKSSLLNALFFDGADILPKAATPMTAALTELTYGEQCSVTVDFFTEDDVLELQKKAAEYTRQFRAIKDKKLKETEENWRKKQTRENPHFSGNPDASNRKQWETLADKAAESELKKNIRLSGAYDQYQKIQNASVQRKTESEQFTVDSITEIAGKLEDYVGANGNYMPFTSKVAIALPIEGLQGISVVDTPGFNDPVPSRDDRARRALRECDVIFILSKATPFLTSTDMEVIGKITRKNGIRELYIIPSQVDGSLTAPEHIKQSGGDLEQAIESVKTILANVVQKNLRTINDDGVFDSLIQNPASRMYITSGQCGSMARTFEHRMEWDSGKKTTWNNLCKSYPDYFSDGEPETSMHSLQQLGNTDAMKHCLGTVKEQKQEIFKQKQAAFEERYRNAAKAVREGVLTYIAEREKEIATRNIGEIEQDIQNLQQLYDELSPELDDVFLETVYSWYAETQATYEQALFDARGTVKTSLKSSEGERTETSTTGHLWWKKYHNRTLTTVNVVDVKNAIDDYIVEYNNHLPHYLEATIRGLTDKVKSAIDKVWTDNKVAVTDSPARLRNRVRSIMAGIQQSYDLKYTGSKFSYEENPTRLEGSSAEDCIDKAASFVGELSRIFRGKLQFAMDDVLSKCKSCQFSKNVLALYLEQLEKKKRDLEKPKLALETLKRMRSEVKAIVW